jgi:hypothetical protein
VHAYAWDDALIDEARDGRAHLALLVAQLGREIIEIQGIPGQVRGHLRHCELRHIVTIAIITTDMIWWINE